MFLLLPHALNFVWRTLVNTHNVILAKADWMCLHSSIFVLPDLKNGKCNESEKLLKF